MRGFILGCWVMCCALLARGQEAPGLMVLPDGGFAPQGAAFRVTFRFAEMKLVSKQTKEPLRILAASESAPRVTEWTSPQGGTVRLDLCCVICPLGLSDVTLGGARLQLANPTDHPLQVTLAVAIAPETAIHGLAFDRHAFSMEGRLVLVADTPSRGAVLADAPFAVRDLSPQDQGHVESAKGECRGEMLFDLTIEPGKARTLGFLCPVKVPDGREPNLDFYRALSIDELFASAKKGGPLLTK